jgi:CHAD domain-containing protein
MADGKWIPGLTVDTLVVDAAHRVLSLRFEVVRRHLPLAATKPEADIEYVHQLRVGTRRARAALDIFADCVPGKVWKRARKQLRQIRLAAGDARDWDVFQETLHDWSMRRPAGEQPALDFLHGLAFERRLQAQQELVDADEKGLDRTELVASLREPGKRRGPRRLGEMALPVLEAAMTDLDSAITDDSAGFEYLHRVRILGKRTRYAMEVFADCFAPRFRQAVYPLVEEMQEILGTANDSHVAVQRLEEIRDRWKRADRTGWTHCRTGFERFLDMHKRRLPEARKKFVAWRTRWTKQMQPLSDLLLAPTCPAAK